MKAFTPGVRIWLIILLLLSSASLLRPQEPVAIDTIIIQQDQFSDHTDRHASITPRQLPPGKWKEIKSEKKYWFADSAYVKKPKSNDGMPFFMQGWVKMLFWILVVNGFAIALAFFLYYNNIRLFRKKDMGTKTKESSELPEDIFDIDLESALKKALAANDHRLAIRLQFLSLLRSLSEKQLIQYRQDRTNMDYIFQLSGKFFYADFFRVVRHYEYSWYGHFEVSSENYRQIDSDFKKLIQQLS